MLQVTFPWKAMMTNRDDYDSLVAHLYDLEEKAIHGIKQCTLLS